MALRLGEAKAAVVAGRSSGIVIASDQAAAEGERILGKPGGEAKAVAMLESVSGREVVFYTSLVVANCETGRSQRHVDETRVRFRRLQLSEILQYVACEQPFDCAGAIKSEGAGIALLDSIETQDPTALIGLPLIRLAAFLRGEGASLWPEAVEPS